MIKSIANTESKIWIGIDILLFGLAVFLFLFLSQQPFVLSVSVIAILYRIKWRSDRLLISDKTVQIDNWFTTTNTILELGKIDNYVFNSEVFAGERLLLIGDKLVLAKIRHKNYSNLPELLSYLDDKLKGRSDSTRGQ